MQTLIQSVLAVLLVTGCIGEPHQRISGHQTKRIVFDDEATPLYYKEIEIDEQKYFACRVSHGWVLCPKLK